MDKRLFFIVLFFCLPPSLFAAKLESLTLQQQAGKMTIMCTLDGQFKHKAFVLRDPWRVVVDFEQVQAAPQVAKLQFKQGFITHFRHGSSKPQTLRLVFDVTQHVNVSTTTWKPKGAHQLGLQINIQPTGGAAHSPIVSVVRQQAPSTITSTHVVESSVQISKPIHAKHEPPRTLRDVIVVLDPGHGGKDPGATGVRRTQEKQVVLAIAMKLKQMIDRQPGMRAVLTRKGDYYIGLRERLNMARKYNADIFVAIHADAYANHNSNGASVFALSQTGATSEAARWLAEKENYSELGGVNLSDLDDRSGVIRTVLLDLSQTATIASSLQMGNRVLRQLDTMTNLHNNKVEQARFVVLKSPDIPSVLIETGFISNPREEINLNSSAYQMRLSRAIFDGIKGYFWAYPPHGSRVEAMSGIHNRLAHREALSSYGKG